MALKKERHKLQSSLANFVFVIHDLPLIWKDTIYQMLIEQRSLIVRTQKDFNERLEAIQLSVFTSHAEIMRKAFYEYLIHHKKDLDNSHHKDYMDKLGWFLFDLRNALAHTEGKLIPRWSETVKSPETFQIEIPVKAWKDLKEFDPNSKVPYKFIWRKIKKERDLKITLEKIYEIALLSYHVLEITKKQKSSTLFSYLEKIKNLKEDNRSG